MRKRKHKIEISDEVYCQAGVYMRETDQDLELFAEAAILSAIKADKERPRMSPEDYQEAMKILTATGTE